jgi:hypothetical protein
MRLTLPGSNSPQALQADNGFETFSGTITDLYSRTTDVELISRFQQQIDI